jgi:hypothetical protein
VEYTVSRGEFTLKKSTGKAFEQKKRPAPIPIDLATDSAERTIRSSHGAAAYSRSETIARSRYRRQIARRCKGWLRCTPGSQKQNSVPLLPVCLS